MLDCTQVIPASLPLLVIEDDDDDIYFLRRALTRLGFSAPVQVMKNSREAVDFLAGQGEYGDRNTYPLPRVVLLDLKMPNLDGFDVLSWIRSQPEFNETRVIVVSGSDREQDRKRAESLGATAYLVKPPAPELLKDLIHS